MTPDEVEEIFYAANSEYETVNSKHTYDDIDRFDEKMNSILVELHQEQDEDEHGMIYAIQETSEYGNVTGGSTLTKFGTLSAYDDSIYSSNSYSERKRQKHCGRSDLTIVR